MKERTNVAHNGTTVSCVRTVHAYGRVELWCSATGGVAHTNPDPDDTFCPPCFKPHPLSSCHPTTQMPLFPNTVHRRPSRGAVWLPLSCSHPASFDYPSSHTAQFALQFAGACMQLCGAGKVTALFRAQGVEHGRSRRRDL